MPDINEKPLVGEGSRNRLWIAVWTGVCLISIFLPWYLLNNFGFFRPKAVSSQEVSTEDRDCVDFAERAAITLNNISYTNQGQQRSDLSGLLSDDMLTLYNRYFYDPDFLRLIADRKLYVTFQKIERSTVESRIGDVVSVKVIGFNTYHSDLTQTQAEYPFSLFIQVEKRPDGKLMVTKVKRL